MKMWRCIWLAALLTIVPVCPSFSAPAPSPPAKLVIGLIPEMNVFLQMDRFKPLASYLSEQTGIEIRLVILSRYGNIVESFSHEKMDGAFFGSFTGALAIEQLKVTPLARPVNLNGESTYRGLLFVKKGSGIKSVQEMKGKRFAFVDRATTAGYIFPLAYLRSNGIESIDGFFSEYFFSGSHDASLNAVLNGKADIGAAKNTVFEFERKREPRIDKEIVILASSAEVPSNGLCVRSNLDAGVQSRLKKVLQEMDKSAKGKEVLEKFGAQKFVETHVKDYQPVIDMALQAGIDLKHYNYTNH